MVDKIVTGLVILMVVVAIYRRVSGLGDRIKESFRDGKELADGDPSNES